MKMLRYFPVTAVALLVWACTATDQADQTQEPVLQFLTGSNTYEVAAEPSEISNISFLTGGAWNAAVSYQGESGWITLEASSGKDAGVHELHVRLSRNVSGKERSGTLSIQSGKADRIKISFLCRPHCRGIPGPPLCVRYQRPPAVSGGRRKQL